MKERLDVLLVKRNLVESREKAKTVILSGSVFVDGKKEEKAKTKVEEMASIEIRGNTLRYVSRGGLKLEKAVEEFRLDLSNKACMDVGASTGGFTDCMLQNGAAKVYAVDVGHGQLAEKLLMDKRVICMEKTNIRYLTEKEIKEKIDFVSIDVSFISLTKVLLPVKTLLAETAQAVCLIKPQFEAGKAQVGKKGVVREPIIHKKVIFEVMQYAKEIGFGLLHLDFSPVKGPEGNIEYLLHIENQIDRGIILPGIQIEEVVKKAHQALN
ncbi:MAG: TlyA family RNA methyltransferase [Lachnospiraceae bacterium]|nr:TlyA family RNA methyltransferase [Lachnospiraceae bacterium]